MRGTPAQQRYGRDVNRLMLVYGTLLAVAIGAFAAFHGRPGAFAWPIALLPALPLAGVFAALGRYLATEQDEFVRLLATRRVLVSTGLVLVLATVWGFLEFFAALPHLNPAFLVMIWFVGQSVGAAVNRATLGSWG